MDLSPNTVVIALEDYDELRSEASDAPPISTKDRIAGTAQATIVFAALAAAGTAAAWGFAKAQNWLEEKNFQRQTRDIMQDLHQNSS